MQGPQYLTPRDKNGIRLWITFSEASYKTLTPNILVPAVQNFSIQRSGDVLLGLFFYYDSWWRWLASRWIFLGHYFYLPYELISSHGRKGRTNNPTNRQGSESWPFTQISKLMCIQEILPDSHCLQMVGKRDQLPWKTDEKQELVKRPSLFSNKTFPK